MGNIKSFLLLVAICDKCHFEKSFVYELLLGTGESPNRMVVKMRTHRIKSNEGLKKKVSPLDNKNQFGLFPSYN